MDNDNLLKPEYDRYILRLLLFSSKYHCCNYALGTIIKYTCC